MKVMIVESPNKVKSIESYLGAGWKVTASFGHIRDLPSNQIAVSPPDYKPLYELTERGVKLISQLRKLVETANEVYLATDPDREGEAISWHLKQALKLENPKRVTFSSLTKDVILQSVAAPRAIDTNLVKAQETRRILDRLVGYQVSPVLMAKLKQNASAGRVQSPAVRLVVDRERQIKNFRETEHFGASLIFDQGAWKADWITKPFIAEGEEYLLDRAMAKKASEVAQVKVVLSEHKDQGKSPPPAFSTSSLLQAASASLRFKPDQTSKVSQSLFEKGLITYHRTDSVNLSASSVAEIREYAEGEGLPLPPSPRSWSNKDGAQEGHEAIRPTNLRLQQAGDSEDERRLYDLIYKRSLACQLADAIYSVTKLGLESIGSSSKFSYVARGSVLKKQGWKSVMEKDATDEDEIGDEAGNIPLLETGTVLQVEKGEVLTKLTAPPKRYTQAGLIKKLEALGIGRPSTFASTIKGIMDRGYVEDKKNQLHPTEKAFQVIDTLVGNFEFVEYEYTRLLEEKFDKIALGQAGYLRTVAELDAQLQRELGSTGIDISTLGQPSENQIKLAQQIAAQMEESLPSEVLSDRGALSKWIDVQRKKQEKVRTDRMSHEPASEAQIGVIQRAIDAQTLKVPDAWPNIDKLTASKLINEVMKSQKKTRTATKKSKR